MKVIKNTRSGVIHTRNCGNLKQEQNRHTTAQQKLEQKYKKQLGVKPWSQ